ncbi:MAG: hypothetical protein ABL912_06995 [Novosphingobium sp.]
MRRTMNRIFLAILALFAGIATQAAPAEARVRGETEIGATLGHKAAVRSTEAVQVALEFRLQTGQQPVLRSSTTTLLYLSGFTTKTVQVGPDRARE